MGQGNVFTGVCDSVHVRGGGCLPQCMLVWDTTTPPRSRHPPEQTPPGSRHPPGSRPLPGADTPREQIPLGADPPPRSRHLPPRSRHPPEADTPLPGSRLRHTVNERPERIHLKCILVCTNDFTFTPLLQIGKVWTCAVSLKQIKQNKTNIRNRV